MVDYNGAQTGTRPSPRTNPSTHSSLVQSKPEWPRAPQKLTSNARSDVFSTSLDVILTGFPIAFVLAGLAIHLDGVEVSHYGDRVYLPIVFAAIVGNLTRYFALWKASNSAPSGVSCPEF